MNRTLLDQVRAWIADDPDVDDRSTLSRLVERGDEVELSRRFAVPLSFGTAGLRGPVMAGPAGMNRLTVRRTTQGVIAWLDETGIGRDRGVVVGRDARNGSEAFNDEVVSVLLGAGVRVIEMPGPLPTPFVAYCVKALGAGAGIMITASHNPPADNGYKLYSHDGAQIIAPNDEIVERHARISTTPPLGDRSSPRHSYVPSSTLDGYREHFAQRFAVPGDSPVPITYTPLHGVGGATMMELFARAGHSAVTPVDEQFAPDAAFPTLPFPNPEEPGALDLAIAAADRAGSSLVIANDPDADRLGAAVRGVDGWHVLRGDEIGWLLASELLGAMDQPSDVVATTIVSSTLLREMAAEANVRFATTLTGFKWISRAAADGVLRFGYEEALGYAVDPAVADKDGMSAALALAKLAHGLSLKGRNLLDRLDEIESHFGVHAVSQLALRFEGDGAQRRIAAAASALRVDPPDELGGLAVSDVIDLMAGYQGLAATEGMYLVLGSTGRVVVRPSGTEPKLKAYIEVVGAPVPLDGLAAERTRAGAVVEAVRGDLARILAG